MAKDKIRLQLLSKEKSTSFLEIIRILSVFFDDKNLNIKLQRYDSGKWRKSNPKTVDKMVKFLSKKQFNAVIIEVMNKNSGKLKAELQLRLSPHSDIWQSTR